MRAPLFASVAACALAAGSAWAQPPENRSVYRIDPLTDGVIIGSSSAVVAGTYLFANDLIRKRCPCDPAEVNSFDRGAIGNRNVFLDNLSDATAGAALIGPVVADAIALGASRELVEDLVVYAEALSVSGAAVSLVKYSVQRPLPRTYEGSDPGLTGGAGGYRSFYSGHASSTFAALAATSMTLSFRYGTGLWPWLATTAVGASVCIERVEAGRHFPTDVIVGALAGSAIGVAVPWLHRRERDLHLSLLPGPGGEGLGLAWSARF